MSRRFIVDTDTASDDAVALVMALREPSVTVDAITVVAGNVPLDQAVQNALYTVELCGDDVPVFAGCAAPMLRDLETAQDVHGVDGFGDIGLALEGRSPADGHAVDIILERFMAEPGTIDLVTIGPLTNIAVALLREPGLANAIRRCWVMGGAGQGPGNVTPLAEFNFWVDPEAVRVVLRSGVPLTFIGWDISVRFATFDADDAAAIRSIGTPYADFALDIQAVLDEYARSETGLAGFDLPDPVAMAVAIDPSLATSERRFVDIGVGFGLDRGKDVVDWFGVSGRDPNVDVVTAVDRDRFVAMLHRQLG